MTDTEHTTRISALDSLRGFLMLCVVWGHLMEILPGMGSQHPLYKVIYSFHMPAFLFLSGFLGKFRWKTVLKFLGISVVFQVLYRLFYHIVLSPDTLETFQFNFSKPYWILWYLLVLCYYYLTIPVLRRIKDPYQPLVLLTAVALALLSGFIPSIGYPFSLSRAFFFYPYFVAGYYVSKKKHTLLAYFRQMTPAQRKAYGCLAVFGLVVAVLLCLYWDFSPFMLYGSYPYRPGYTPWTRLQMMAVAALWIHFLFCFVWMFPKKQLAFLNTVGKHTLPIYLLHGFLVKWLGLYI